MNQEKIKIRNFVRKLNNRGRILGVGVFDADYKICNPRLIVLTFFIIGYFMVSAYCFNIYAHQLEKLIFCGVTFGFLVKAVTQIAAFIGQRDKFLRIMQEVEKFYAIFNTSNDNKIPKIFKKFHGFMIILSKLLDIAYWTTGLLSLLNPIIVKMFTGDLILPYGFQLPFMQPFSLQGYFLNYIYSMTCCILCVIGFNISDTFFVVTVMPIYAVFHVLYHLIDELKKFDNTDDKDNANRGYEEKFNEIVKIHQKLLDFINDVEMFYNASNFIIIYTIFIQCVASLFALIVVKWYIGLAFVVLNLMQIFIYCVFGAILEMVQAKFRVKIAEINWTDKNLSVRRKVLFILTTTKKVQHFTCIFGILNFDTYMNVSD